MTVGVYLSDCEQIGKNFGDVLVSRGSLIFGLAKNRRPRSNPRGFDNKTTYIN